MSNDIVMQLSSNSNPSDPSFQERMTKLEARMTGKSSSSSSLVHPVLQSNPTPLPKFGGSEEVSGHESSSDSDDDNGGEYMILQNSLKRQRVPEDDVAVVQPSEGVADGKKKVAETTDIRSSPDESSRKKQGRGRGRSATGRGRGSKVTDQMRSLTPPSTVSPSNGHLEYPSNKENGHREQLGNSERASSQEDISLLHRKVASLEEDISLLRRKAASLEEDISLLRRKAASLEEDLSKSQQETADHQQRSCLLEKELKDFKERDQQTKTKRIKVLSDLLISISKAERQEARMKIQQESLRLGNVGVIRAGTVISETWEDGQALKGSSSDLDLIRRCLTYNQAERADVLTIAQDPYLSYAKR